MDADEAKSEIESLTSTRTCDSVAGTASKKIRQLDSTRTKHSIFGFLHPSHKKSEIKKSSNFQHPSSEKLDVVEQKLETPVSQKQSFSDVEILPVTFKEISKAFYKIREGIEQTECKPVNNIKELSGWEVYFKMETMQHSGSYKDRGVRFALLMLSEDQKKRGVITTSCGNLALSLARQGLDLGIPVTIVMARDSPMNKALRCKEDKAMIRIHGQNQEEAEAIARKLGKEKGLQYIDESNNRDVISGHGTLGLEIINQLPQVDAIVLPVAQGALLAGVCVAVKTMFPTVQIIAVERKSCPKFTVALQQGIQATADTNKTSSLTIGDDSKVGEIPFEIAVKYVDTVVTVSEDDIALGMVRALQNERRVVEESGAIALGALLGGYLPELKGKCVVVPLTSGNVDACVLERAIERGLAVTGTLVQFIVTLSDQRGSLARLTKMIVSTGACIKHIRFQRSWLHSSAFTLQAKVVVEVLSCNHARELRTLLEKHYKISWNVDLPPGEYEKCGLESRAETMDLK